MLFSGGLDSLAGAMHLLAAGKRLVLVGHHDFGQLARVQQTLAAALLARFGPQACHYLAVRLQLPCAAELTLRSRSFLYLSLGLSVAAAFPSGLPVVVPENGWIGLNPPLTPNRLGTLSTRTTHPLFLKDLAAIWRAAGLNHAIRNPWQWLSKGEVLTCCPPADLRPLAPLSLSCARPVASRWQGQPMAACGYCYPCLLRRAALHRLGWDDGRHYRYDVLGDPALLRHRVRGGDLRALLLALKTWRERPQEILARLMFPGAGQTDADGLDQVRRLLAAGFQEVDNLLADKGHRKLLAYLKA